MTTEPDSEARGLICAYELDGNGGARTLDWTEIEAAPRPGKQRWIHLDFTNPHAYSWVKNKSRIDSVIADALLDDDSRPRAIQHGDGLLTILRGVNTNPGSVPEDMVSIRAWLEADRIVTTRRRHLLSIQTIRDDLINKTGPKNAAALLVALASKLGDRIGPVIEELDEIVENAETQFSQHTAASYRGEFAALRRQAMRIRRFLTPQREGLERLAKQDTHLLTNEEKFEFREAADQVTRYLEDLDLIRERAMVAQEELISQLAQEQNRRMYMLAIVAGIFLPLSFLTGLMGMNVAGLPGTEDPKSFTILAFLMIGAAAGILAFFKWRKWL